MSTFEAICFALVWFFILTFAALSIVEHYASKIEKKIDEILSYMSIIEQIRAEINKLYCEYKDKFHQFGDQYHLGLIDGLDMADQVLSTLESEKPVPTDLEEAAKEYAKTTFKKPYSDNPDEEVTIVEPDKYAGFIAGAKWDREQMMKEAVKTEVTETCGISSVWIKTKKFKPGQKVRSIIVKEDSHE